MKKKTYFILLSKRIDYPIYVAYLGYLPLGMVRECEVLWSVISNLTGLGYNDFFYIEYCTDFKYKKALIKIDFTYKDY